jgi:hypothetical protein
VQFSVGGDLCKLLKSDKNRLPVLEKIAILFWGGPFELLNTESEYNSSNRSGAHPSVHPYIHALTDFHFFYC